jgi:hypothetical protein
VARTSAAAKPPVFSQLKGRKSVESVPTLAMLIHAHHKPILEMCVVLSRDNAENTPVNAVLWVLLLTLALNLASDAIILV